MMNGFYEYLWIALVEARELQAVPETSGSFRANE